MTSRINITESVINLLRGIMGRAGILRPMTAILTFCLCPEGPSTRVLSCIRKQYAFLSILIVVLSSVSIPASAQEIWLSGVSPFVRQKMFQESESDYFELFKPDAAWSKSAQHVKVFMINGGVVMHETDKAVQALFAELKRRHIALAIEMGLMSGKGPDGKVQECGVGVEGFGSPVQMSPLAGRPTPEASVSTRPAFLTA
jgi:hypothetical protein